MFTRPPDVDDVELAAALTKAWGLDVVALDYLAVGFGSHHWRATTGSGAWFVTVDDLVAKRQESSHDPSTTRAALMGALTTARALLDAGLEFVVAPIIACDGEAAWEFSERYVVAVYPFVEGRRYDYGTYSDSAHRDSVVRCLDRLHGAPASCRRWARTETFSIARRGDLFASMAQLGERWDSGPFADPARRLLARHADAVAVAFKRFDALAMLVGSQRDRFVLTHGEPHPANTITTDQGIVLVDWDTTLIAPPERDLWDLVTEEPSIASYYHELTGNELTRDAIELYRLAWDLSEIAIYVTEFRQPHDRTDDTQEAWRNLKHFLDPSRW